MSTTVWPGLRRSFAVGETLNYLLNRRAGTKVARRVFEALEPGGLFIFDVATARHRVAPQHIKITADWAVLVEFRLSHGGERVERSITTFFRTKGGMYRRRHEVHRVVLYDSRELAAQLRRIGFRVTVRRSYGKYAVGKHAAAFLCRKPR